jgi:hypothetical protein
VNPGWTAVAILEALASAELTETTEAELTEAALALDIDARLALDTEARLALKADAADAMLMALALAGDMQVGGLSRRLPVDGALHMITGFSL